MTLGSTITRFFPDRLALNNASSARINVEINESPEQKQVTQMLTVTFIWFNIFL